MAQPLLKSKGKKGEKISSMVVTTTHEDKHSKIDNDDNDDLSHRSVSSRNDSALLQALTRLSIASSSSSSASTSYTMGSARSSEQYNHSKSSTKKRGLLKNKIAQGIRKSLAPSTMHSIATPSSSLSRSTIPLAPLSSSSSTLHSTTTTTSTSSSSLLKTKGVDNDIDDAISRISLPSTITDSRRERLKGRAVGFADVVSVSVGGGDLVDSDDEDSESLQSCETRVFTGRRTRTSFRSSAASFTSSSSSSSLSSSSSSTVKFEYKTDDESDTDHDDVYSIQHYTGDSEFGDEDSYRTRNTNNEEAMNRAFRRISLAPAAFAAAKASRASVGGQRRFSVFQSTAEKVSSLINEEEEEEEDEDVNEQSVMTSLSDTPTTPCSESVFGTFLSSIFEYLPNSDISSSTSLVSKSWFAQSTHMLSWRAASAMTSSNFKRMVAQRGGGGGGGGKKYVGTDDRTVSSSLASCKRSWVAFLECYPWGRFLAEGAYKSVFKVWSAPRRRMEAVSVMDINAIAETGNLPIIQAEIQAACLLSHLVRTDVCPNFLNTFQVFVFGASPSNQEDFQGLWGAPSSCEGRVGTSGRNNGIEEDNSDEEDNNDSGNDNDSCPFDSVDIPNVAVAEKIISSSSLTSQLKKRAQQCTRRVKTLKEHLPANFTAASAASSPSLHGSYQFIRMELCSSGDVEELLRRREPQVLAVEMDAVKASVGNRGGGGGGGESFRAAQLALKRADTHAAYEAADMAFQMAFSLYAARERLSFRHFDVKLLNFLAKPARDLVIEELVDKKGLAKKINGKESSIVRLAYSIGERIVNVDLPLGEGGEESTCGHIIKLADYGTASTNASSIDNAVHYTHFTTLENAPPEYMILGDAATQGFGADTWALGLCILHLFTGSCPYEEMMTSVARGDEEEETLTTIKNSSRTSNKSKNNSVVGVVCPQPLKDALRKVWMTTEVSPISSSSASSLSNSADVQQMEKGGKKSNTKSKKEVVAAPNQESASSKRKAVCRASLSSLGVCVEWICEDEEDGGDKNVNKKGSSSSSSSYASYRVIKKVLESSSDVTETADVLADTLYRYAVLLGLPEEGHCGNYSSVNPVWVLLNAACKGMTDKIGPSDADAAGGDGGKKTKKKSKKQEFASPSSAVLLTLSDIATCSSQYQADQRFASVDRGTNALLQRARRRSETLLMSLQQPKQPVKSNSSSSSMSISSGGAEKRNSNLLLDIVCGSEGLLAWDVKNRPTMASFLKNEVLHSGLKKMQSNDVDNDDDDDDDASNVVYKKKISFYSGDSLPDV